MRGLGICSLFSKNLSLLSKWNVILMEKEALWHFVIKDFYGGNGGFSSPSDSFGVTIVPLTTIENDISYMHLILPITLVKSGFKDEQMGICWVKWKSILLNSNMRGLGIRSLFSKNLSLLSKWNVVLMEKEALWHFVIKDLYGGNGGFSSPSDSFGVVDGLTLSYNETYIDSWRWTMDGSCYFKVKTLTKYIQSLSLADCDLGTKSSERLKEKRAYGALRRGANQGVGFMNMRRIEL
nr:RNA-directed DNA polymerase, eukaryota, reverse transcriptase zinc-binding domain protein [Tanacetum cinerariifolium]